MNILFKLSLILFIAGKVFALEISPLTMVDLSTDSYLDTKKFIKKYKNHQNNVVASTFNDVEFFVIEEKNDTVVVIRGTQNRSNIKSDLAIKHKYIDKSIQVHQGFYNIAYGIDKIISNKLSNRKKVTITGHSLGGAVALLLGSILYDKNYDVQIFSFGSPPAVNQAFNQKYIMLNHYRYEHRFDAIPKLSKKTISTIQKILATIGENHMEYLKTRLLLAALTNAKYKFIQHGKKVVLKNSPVIPLSDQNKSFAKRVLLKPIHYHSILTYQHGIY